MTPRTVGGTVAVGGTVKVGGTGRDSTVDGTGK